MNAKVEIWITDKPLREQDWLDYGFDSLEHYIEHLASEGDPVNVRKYSYLPLVSFGTFDEKTGAKEVVLTCSTFKDLPKENIEGIIEFK